MEDIKKYEEDFFLLLEAGFVAINQADEDAAVKLFKACELLRPTHALIGIGLGYLHLHKLELKAAIRSFEEVIARDPNNEMARCLLGVAFSLTPDQGMQGENILQEVARKSSESEVQAVGKTALHFIDECIKKPGNSAKGG